MPIVEGNEQVIFLVWKGRPVSVRCAGLESLTEEKVTYIQTAIEEFLVECHHEFIHYVAVQASLDTVRNQLRQGDREGDLIVAFGRPGEQSTLDTRVTWGEAADFFSEEGESRGLSGRSFVVLVYALWETVLRPRLAETIGVELSDVRSDIMGDWRLLRHWLLYRSRRSERNFFARAEGLATALGSKRNAPEVTPQNIAFLVRCLDSLEIIVDPNGQGLLATPVTADPATWHQMQQDAQSKGMVPLPLFPKKPY